MYKKYLLPITFLSSALLLLAGCSHSTRLLNFYKHKSAQPFTYHFSDGGKAQYFYIKKSIASSRKSPTDPMTYVFVVGGSDCASFAHFLPQYFRGLEGESGDIHIYMLQKRFIGAHTWGRYFGCSQQFVRADHPTQWIADQLEFIQQQLAVLAMPANRRIVILGISEGGEIAPILARRIAQTTHLVILANGGLNPLAAYALQRAKQGLAPSEKLVELLEAPAQDTRKNTAVILGRTPTYWLQVNATQQIQNLLALRIPILMAMGVDDPVVPIESAWYAQEQFEKQGNKNLSLLAYPKADHSLSSENMNYLPDFFHKMDIWLSMGSPKHF